jgi:neurotransmitter:Na+ symporter, NSS family
MKREKNWSSSLGFILACVGSAVGLGNIWKFPYITYENGGGAFVLIYLIAILLVGLPIIIAEMMIGRHGDENVYGTFKDLSKNNPFWKGVGVLCLFTAFLILSYYSVVAGWTIEYFWQSITGALSSVTIENSNQRFGAFVSSGPKQIFYHSIFIFMTAFIVIRGTKGIERAVKILMPILGVFILIIASVSISKYGIGSSAKFLFTFDLSKLTGHAILEAVGHAFFTLSVGMGAMLVYGSYLAKGESLIKAGLWIGFLDTMIALMACFMMYPIILGTDMELSQSASMLFTALSVQFNALPGGSIIGAMFYSLVAFAALSSTISILEPVVSFANETFGWSRKKATIISALTAWFVGIGSALSNGAVELFTNLKVMDRFDYLASNWTLPIGGMLISLFCGWVLTHQDKKSELLESEQKFYASWNFIIRYVSPLLVLIVILNKIGILNF